MQLVIIHYGEIGIKGKNREFFERKLMENIKKGLGNNAKKVYRRYGRIVAEVKDFQKSKMILEKTPGIEYFSPAKRVENDIEKIKEKVVKILNGKDFETFKIESKRSYKKFPLTSLEINKSVGAYVVHKFGKKVSMKSPDIRVFIEICEKESFVYTEKFYGIGGLPVTTGGKVICLLSGGIDSPVASFLIMKRGCKVIFVHFFNKTLHSSAVRKKIENIVKILSAYQNGAKLYMVDFSIVQNEIIKTVSSSYRMVMYRRIMTRIANEIAKRENAKALVTGDSIGQVASQTLDNLKIIYEVAKVPVLAPLSGMDKKEVIEIAKKIGTYNISIQPYPDCCSLMIAKHPVTKPDPKLINKFESEIDVEKLINQSLKKTEILEM